MASTRAETGPGAGADSNPKVRKRPEIIDAHDAGSKQIHHGQTLAAWVGSLTAMVAVIVGGLAVVLWNWPLFWGSMALLVIAGIAAKVLQRTGHGAY